MTDYNYYKNNSDPAIKAAKAAIAQKAATKQQTAAKAQLVQVKTTQQEVQTQVKPMIPATTLNIANMRMQQTNELAKTKDVKTIKIEVADETPVELELEAKSLAI